MSAIRIGQRAVVRIVNCVQNGDEHRGFIVIMEQTIDLAQNCTGTSGADGRTLQQSAAGHHE